MEISLLVSSASSPPEAVGPPAAEAAPAPGALKFFTLRAEGPLGPSFAEAAAAVAAAAALSAPPPTLPEGELAPEMLPLDGDVAAAACGAELTPGSYMRGEEEDSMMKTLRRGEK